LKKILIIGIDGGTPDLIKKFTLSGELPFFKKLMEEGCSGELKSTVPALTPPAWTSSFTGVNPGKHNIFDFFVFDKNSKSLRLLSSMDRKYPAIWEILSYHNIKCGFYNVPCSYPVDKVNGFMVSGMATPAKSASYAYPEEVEEYVQKEKNGKFGASTFHLEKGNRVKFLEEIYEITEIDEKISVELMKKINPLVMMHIYDESDRVMHFYWHDFDESHPKYVDGTKFKDEILRYYRRIEKGIQNFLKEFGDCDLIIYSDHGFGPLYKDVYVNKLLHKWGYLKVNEYAEDVLKKSPIKKVLKSVVPPKIRKFLRENIKSSPLANPLGFIDFTKSSAVFTSVSGRSVVILDEKRKNEIANELKERFMNYIDEETQNRPFVKVWKKEEVYKGEWLENAPDLILEEDGRYAFKTDWSLYEEIKVSSQYGAIKSGSHRKNGFLILYGNSFEQKEKIEEAEIVDICPTILYLLGLPVGLTMDGKPLIGYVKEPEKIKFEDYGSIRKIDLNSQNIDEEQVKEKLKNLGYM